MGSTAEGTSDPEQTVHADNILPVSAPHVSQTQRGESLALGTRISEFEVKGFVGEGGFSIVYLAWDHSLDRHVALKEYMPSSLAARNGATDVVVRSARHRETFDIGLRSFINEGKLLASFDHPSLVKVYRFWEAHGTAYMAMPYYEGTTLKQTVRAMSQPPDEAWLRTLLDPLTQALSVIHGSQCYHRDIAPDNVMLLANTGAPLLLDFGAARRVIGDKTQALTVILKPGYAPIEQYAEDPALKQGPWTDVYALCAVVYWAVTGKTPPAAVGRMLNDAHVPLAQCAAGRYSATFLAAVDRGLQVQPQHRTRTIRQLRREWGLEASADTTVATADDAQATVLLPSNAPVASKVTSAAASPATPTAPSQPRPQPRREEPVASQASTALRTPQKVLGAVSILGAASALLWWWASGTGETAQAPTPAAQAPASPSSPSSSPAAAPTPTVSATPPAPIAPSVTATQALAQLVADRDPIMGLKATLTQRGDTARLRYSASQSGRLYVIGLAANGNELVLAHPAAPSAEPGKTGARGDIEVPLPASIGVQSYHAVLAREARDLRADGWIAKERSWVWNAAGATSAWGPARCPAASTRCSSAYDVTEVNVTNVTEVEPVATPAPRPAPTAAAPSPSTSVRTRSDTTGNSARCADALRRFSLGDTSPELIEEMKSLRCR
jgi:serine/threonine protein kinase